MNCLCSFIAIIFNLVEYLRLPSQPHLQIIDKVLTTSLAYYPWKVYTIPKMIIFINCLCSFIAIVFSLVQYLRLPSQPHLQITDKVLTSQAYYPWKVYTIPKMIIFINCLCSFIAIIFSLVQYLRLPSQPHLQIIDQVLTTS
jgi:hypothetical protein